MGEPIQRVIHRQEFIVIGRRRNLQIIGIHALLTAAVTERLFPAGVIDQDVAHCLGRSGEEMGAVLKLSFALLAHEPQPGFMHQRRGLQRVSRRTVGHPGGGDAPEFVIDNWQQFRRGFGIAVVDLVQNARDVAHGMGSRYQTLLPNRSAKWTGRASRIPVLRVKQIQRRRRGGLLDLVALRLAARLAHVAGDLKEKVFDSPDALNGSAQSG